MINALAIRLLESFRSNLLRVGEISIFWLVYVDELDC